MELQKIQPHSGDMRPHQLPDEKGLEDSRHTLLLLAGLGFAGFGLQKRGLAGMFSAGVGTALIYQYMRDNQMLGGGLARQLLNTGACSASVSSTITINRPVEEVYRRFRNLEELPAVMEHIQRVERLAEGLYRWTARIPKTDKEVSWNARVLEDVEGERILWRSMEGSEIHNQGMVQFRPGANDHETEVVANIEYRAPGGAIGKSVASFLNAIPKQFIKENLRNFKRMVETGEIPTIDGQSSGRLARS